VTLAGATGAATSDCNPSATSSVRRTRLAFGAELHETLHLPD
jgi:hypothetical protein